MMERTPVALFDETVRLMGRGNSHVLWEMCSTNHDGISHVHEETSLIHGAQVYEVVMHNGNLQYDLLTLKVGNNTRRFIVPDESRVASIDSFIEQTTGFLARSVDCVKGSLDVNIGYVFLNPEGFEHYRGVRAAHHVIVAIGAKNVDDPHSTKLAKAARMAALVKVDPAVLAGEASIVCRDLCSRGGELQSTFNAYVQQYIVPGLQHQR